MYSSSRGDPDVRCAEVRGWMSEKPGTNFFFFFGNPNGIKEQRKRKVSGDRTRLKPQCSLEISQEFCGR